ncbi:hypothetical protein JCM33374_g4516 [Metschnikowia sp. JCM 33374]|nr:hypothetical protein JCM33374_g4516 [Metschnikowia sp. JCM 33374]
MKLLSVAILSSAVTAIINNCTASLSQGSGQHEHLNLDLCAYIDSPRSEYGQEPSSNVPKRVSKRGGVIGKLSSNDNQPKGCVGISGQKATRSDFARLKAQIHESMDASMELFALCKSTSSKGLDVGVLKPRADALQASSNEISVCLKNLDWSAVPNLDGLKYLQCQAQESIRRVESMIAQVHS